MAGGTCGQQVLYRVLFVEGMMFLTPLMNGKPAVSKSTPLGGGSAFTKFFSKKHEENF